MANLVFENEDALFVYTKGVYLGMDFHFRTNKATREIDMMISDNYAKVHGFETLREMFEGCLGYKIADAAYKRLIFAHEWVRVEKDGFRLITDGIYTGVTGDA